MKTKMQQAPIRNATTICASVYSHSGEFAPVYTDLQLTGRGLDFMFIRSYRSSLAGDIGDMGRGWSSSIAKKIERNGEDIIYHNGAGEVYKFVRDNNGKYMSPTGFYGILFQEKRQFFIHQRYGLVYRFEVPEKGGRILDSEDRNHNSIQFSYSANAIVIIDSLKRKIDISINKGLLQELKDHTGRTWKYSYDKNDCLIEVTQPATADFPNGTSVKYGYDNNHRLISVTDAKGQKYLVNHYDKSGKVVAQEHGSGVFKMEYDAIGEEENGLSTHRTTCIRKNGSRLVLEHNGFGNVISRTLYVRKDSFASQDITEISEDDVPVITNSVYNKNLELTRRIFPAGNKTEWVYNEDAEDSLNQGNLLQIIKIPQMGIETDQTKIVTEYEVEPKFQLTTKLMDPRGNQTSYEYDEKGNLIVTTYPSVTIQPVNGGTPRPKPLDRIQQDEYQYNSMGQLLRRKHIDGSITEYHYYPVDDPSGTRGLNTATNNPDKICGYLARVVRDANGKKIKNEYIYDHFGNVTTVVDGKGNSAHVRYNAMGKVENVTSREPFKNRINYKYDANYNEIESAQSFERLTYDETNQTTKITSSTLRELKEYNELDNVTLRKIVGDDKMITEYFIRDADENIIRQIQPLGNATEYVYDERNLLIEKKFGVGTRETFSNQFTYTLNDAVRTYTDGNGKKTTNHYDGFHRNKGITNPVGKKITQWFDEANNLVRLEIDGDNSLATKKSKVGHRSSPPLMEAKYHFDQWNRVYRVDQAWHNHSNGHKLGESQWNGEKGIVSTILEYAENGLPGKVWTETDNVVDVEYDGVGRIVQMKDLTGEEFSFEYDENNNPTLMRCLGPEVEGKRFEQVLRRSHDEMDRLVWQQENDEAPERFAYNAIGNIINYVGKSGIEIQYTDDSLGRRVGHAFKITDALDNTRVQKIARRLEYDDNYRLSAYTDAAGKRTIYRYDTLDRQTGVVYPDGNSANVEYDANGNIVRVVDQNNNEINNRYDASNLLVERRSHIKKEDKTTVERYEYDGLSRMVAAIALDGVIRRTYDSLSRSLTEQQGDHTLRFAHDSAGNLTSLVYPGGEEVHKMYDIRNRVTSVKNKLGETIASFNYRANDQIAEMFLGNMIETSFSYNPQERLESIEYRRTNNQELVEGFRYQYDDTGKMSHEIQLSVGSTYGERYYYDEANRPTRAQYGVQNVFDPNSSFENETSYEHFSEGSWKRLVDVDGQGKIIDEKIGTINQINKYKHFGNISFKYDANGNCIRKGKSNPGYCDYTYDQDNKLVKSECYDAQGNKTQTIEYFYDSLGRQVRKVVTDKNDIKTETTFIWFEDILLEEWENGVLARTYFYGSGHMPVQLSVNKGGRFDLNYTYNGRGVVSGLVDSLDPNRFLERYGVKLDRSLYVKEIDGKLLDPHSTGWAKSSVGNSVSGKDIIDWANGTVSSIGGMHNIPGINLGLNGLNNFGKRVPGSISTSSFFKQANNYLKNPGRRWGKGGNNAHGTAGFGYGLFRNPKAYQYGSVTGTIEYTFKTAAYGTWGVAGTIAAAGLAAGPGMPVVEGVALQAVEIGGALWAIGEAVGWLPKMFRGPRDEENCGTPDGDTGKTVPNNATEEAVRAADKAADDKAAADKAAADKAAADKAILDKAAEDAKKDPNPSPDPQKVLTTGEEGSHIRFLTPREIESKFMERARPVNPQSDGDFGTNGSSNGSSGQPSESHGPGVIDPTIALFIDPPHKEYGIGGGGIINTLDAFFGGGFTDPVRPGLDQGRSGEKTPNNGRPLP